MLRFFVGYRKFLAYNERRLEKNIYLCTRGG